MASTMSSLSVASAVAPRTSVGSRKMHSPGSRSPPPPKTPRDARRPRRHRCTHPRPGQRPGAVRRRSRPRAGEHVGTVVGARTVVGAEVLVDPHPHRPPLSDRRARPNRIERDDDTRAQPDARRRIADHRRDAELSGGDRRVQHEPSRRRHECAGIHERLFKDGLRRRGDDHVARLEDLHRRGRIVDDHRPAVYASAPTPIG